MDERLQDYITVREAAARKGVSIPAVYRAIERGELPATQVLGRTALRPADVDAYQPGSYGGVTRTRRRRGPQKREAA